MDNLSHIKIKGFKSIKELDLEMQPINVLIGAIQCCILKRVCVTT
jgi:predicted ATPase